MGLLLVLPTLELCHVFLAVESLRWHVSCGMQVGGLACFLSSTALLSTKISFLLKPAFAMRSTLFLLAPR